MLGLFGRAQPSLLIEGSRGMSGDLDEKCVRPKRFLGVGSPGQPQFLGVFLRAPGFYPGSEAEHVASSDNKSRKEYHAIYEGRTCLT